MPAPKTIFHAHNWRLEHVAEHLPIIAGYGFDAIQISPVQKSPAGRAWYLRYQPYDHLVIEGLGDQIDLQRLCAAAESHNVVIVADLVFNHMAVPAGTNAQTWRQATAAAEQGHCQALESLLQKLDAFPHLTRDDFQPWRPMQGPDWDNDHRYESWGNGEWPELKPTSKVLEIHKQHIQLLYDCGVRAFRFDAVKHMRAEHLQHYTDYIANTPESCWSYGEVLSANRAMHQEYAQLFPTTDFLFVEHMCRQLNGGVPTMIDPTSMTISPNSIRFGTNHDIECNPKELMQGFHFYKPEHQILARCLSLLIEGGVGLVYGAELALDKLVLAAVRHRQANPGLTDSITVGAFENGRVEFADSQQRLTLDFANGRIT